MSLGRTRGAVWVGQPLDLSVQLKLEPGEDVSTVCVAADVFYADSRVSAAQVRVFAEPGAKPDEATVRIRSSAPVDEPVVNIYLKAGCSQAMTRRYVLLAEVPVDYAEQGLAAGSRSLSLPSTSGMDVRPDAMRADSGRGTAESAGPARSVRIPRAAISASPAEAMAAAIRKPAARPVVARAPAAPAAVRSVVRKPAPAKEAGKPRLRLDPAELLIERDPVLRASTQLLSVPQEQDAGARRAEAAALWRAINATPEEVLRDARRLESLQTEAATLRSQNRKSEATIVALQARVQQAQAERYGNWLVYALVAALVAVLAVAGFLWSRSRSQAREQQWWHDDAHPAAIPGGDSFPAMEDAADHRTAAAPRRRGSRLDIDLGSGPSPLHGADAFATQPGLGALDGNDFVSSLTGAGRAVKVEELLDIQQQADFFISLGQYEQAVATLRNHISENVETSALAYLDLLRIYHLQGREKDYALVRKEFNDVFNAEVPEFAAFGQQTRGLESYQSAMSRITALWPTPKVLNVIEESIFRKPGQGNLVFDLEAYRELLMLYAIARELVEESGPVPAFVSSGAGLLASTEPALPDLDDGASERADFQPTRIQPLPTAASAVDGVFRVPPSANLGLDIDLSEIAPASKASPPLARPAGVAESKPTDSHLIDFDLFDMATRAHAASKRGKP